jgi:hypothetical protein
MWRDCGDFDHAHSLLAEARLYAVGLPAEIHELLIIASRAPAGERHVCGSEALPETPLSPVELTMPVVEEDTVLVPVIEEPLTRSFTTLTYLPPHPELLAWEPQPVTPVESAPGRQVSPATLALVAAIVGIVAVTVLLVLLITAARNT